MNINIKAEKQNTYDAIAVGSGISGGWVAKELTEKGLNVLLLERGRNIEHIKDYDMAMMHPLEFKHRGRLTQEQIRTHPVQSRTGFYSKHSEKFWVNDIDCPYTEVKRFDWYRDFHLKKRIEANLTMPHLGRGSCQDRNLCSRGYPFGGCFNTQFSTLPAAVDTGNLMLRPFSIVNSVSYNKEKGRAKGVLVIDTETFPKGLGNSSGQLGHNLMDHHYRIGASGRAEGFDDRYYYGRRPIEIYIPRFRNIGNDKRDYMRGFHYGGSASRTGWQRAIAEMNYGADFKEQMTTPEPWIIGLRALGEALPYLITMSHWIDPKRINGDSRYYRSTASSGRTREKYELI